MLFLSKFLNPLLGILHYFTASNAEQIVDLADQGILKVSGGLEGITYSEET